MRTNHTATKDERGAARPAWRVGCVSYINAKPLIHGLDPLATQGVSLSLDVPARLAAGLASRAYDLALCPVIDYFRAPPDAALDLVPVGGIACEGPTLTVRLFSRVPLEEVTRVHADTDSHTSVALLCVLMDALHGRVPELVALDAGLADPQGQGDGVPQAMLLIGDKVVTACPAAALYPHQLDLGEAWHALTGLPFVFAMWMARRGEPLGGLPSRLASLLESNLRDLPAIAARYAPQHGWPLELAERYMSRILRYAIGPRELAGLSEFARRAGKLGLIESRQP